MTSSELESSGQEARRDGMAALKEWAEMQEEDWPRKGSRSEERSLLMALMVTKRPESQEKTGAEAEAEESLCKCRKAARGQVELWGTEKTSTNSSLAPLVFLRCRMMWSSLLQMISDQRKESTASKEAS